MWRLVVDSPLINQDLTLVRTFDTRDDLDESRFASSVLSHQRMDRSTVDREADVG